MSMEEKVFRGNILVSVENSTSWQKEIVLVLILFYLNRMCLFRVAKHINVFELKSKIQLSNMQHRLFCPWR